MVLCVRFEELSQRLNAKFCENEQILLKSDIFKENEQSFDNIFMELQHVTEYVGADVFNGKYTVVPKTEEQVLRTKKLVMVDDMTVTEIPVYKITNQSGGRTVYIGG